MQWQSKECQRPLYTQLLLHGHGQWEKVERKSQQRFLSSYRVYLATQMTT